ncbi:MAG TPA: YciI family protein [Bryobacteraceae bacterium]|nr:YciI family protein [Bryobacteraceae bacterium]
MDTPNDRFYVLRLIPPRASFGQDMKPEEGAAMRAHVAWWTELVNAGTAIVFGPVADPKGPWGIGIVRVRDEDHVRELTANDPVIKAGIGCSYEVLPMVRAVLKS